MVILDVARPWILRNINKRAYMGCASSRTVMMNYKEGPAERHTELCISQSCPIIMGQGELTPFRSCPEISRLSTSLAPQEQSGTLQNAEKNPSVHTVQFS